MPEKTLDSNDTPSIAILYVNHRGVKALRQIVPNRMWYGTTTWHPSEQWFLDAFDIERQAFRSFAIADILEWQIESANVPVRHRTACEA